MPEFKIDLHGMNRGVAHSAVRVSLQHHLIQSKHVGKMERDVWIITGRGRNSRQHLRPILRPEGQRMLVEEFYPPLGSSTASKNTGALKVSVTDINAWIEHQQQQLEQQPGPSRERLSSVISRGSSKASKKKQEILLLLLQSRMRV